MKIDCFTEEGQSREFALVGVSTMTDRVRFKDQPAAPLPHKDVAIIVV